MIQRAKKTAAKVQKEVKKNIVTAILAALAFVIALVWRDAIQSLVDRIIEALDIQRTGYIYKILIAIIITVVCVLAILYFSRWKEES